MCQFGFLNFEELQETPTRIQRYLKVSIGHYDVFLPVRQKKYQDEISLHSPGVFFLQLTRVRGKELHRKSKQRICRSWRAVTEVLTFLSLSAGFSVSLILLTSDLSCNGFCWFQPYLERNRQIYLFRNSISRFNWWLQQNSMQLFKPEMRT